MEISTPSEAWLSQFLLSQASSQAAYQASYKVASQAGPEVPAGCKVELQWQCDQYNNEDSSLSWQAYAHLLLGTVNRSIHPAKHLPEYSMEDYRLRVVQGSTQSLQWAALVHLCMWYGQY